MRNYENMKQIFESLESFIDDALFSENYSTEIIHQISKLLIYEAYSWLENNYKRIEENFKTIVKDNSSNRFKAYNELCKYLKIDTKMASIANKYYLDNYKLKNGADYMIFIIINLFLDRKYGKSINLSFDEFMTNECMSFS